MRREKRRALCCLLFLLLLGGTPVSGQTGQALLERGMPFSATHYPAQEYRAQPQNWGVTQDHRGLIYVANNDGILQYDGARWRLIRTTTNTFVRSVAADAAGRVYAGTVGDFGYLRPDTTGRMRYVSLARRLKTGERDFSDVWNVHPTDEGVYFQATERLFRWDGQEIKTWKSKEGFHTSFAVRGRLYVREVGRGLLRMEGDSLRLVPGGERFADVPIYLMVPQGGQDILVGTRKEKLLLYDGASFSAFPTQADGLLGKYRLYHGCTLPGGGVALATLGGGVFIIDWKGRLVQVLDAPGVLPDGVVNYVFPDRQGGLWMALHNKGIVRAEVPSALSRYDERSGLEGVIESIQRHRGRLYVATGAGLYALQDSRWEESVRERFVPVRGASHPVPHTWDVLPLESTLLAATERGIYQVQGRKGRAVRRVEEKVYMLKASEHAPGRIYAGTVKGVSVLQRDRWALQPIARIEGGVRSIVEGKDGALWLATAEGEVLRVPFPREAGYERGRRVSMQSGPRPVRFGPADGLSADVQFIASVQDEPVFASKEGLYRQYRGPDGEISFRKDTLVAGPISAQDPLLGLNEDTAGDVWLLYEDRIEIARRRPGGTYEREVPDALQFPRSPLTLVNPRPDGSAWISDRDELIHYDAERAARLRKKPRDEPVPLIREVRVAATGEVLYRGAADYGNETASSKGGEGPEKKAAFGKGEASGKGKTPKGKTSAPVTVPYRGNTLDVSFALPDFGGPWGAVYQYRLGDQDEWTQWSKKSTAVLANLYEGTYRLQVRARKRKQGMPAQVATLNFRVLPPWYRTIWAFALYLAAAALLTVGYRRYRHLQKESRRAQEQAQALVRERRLNERLEQANVRLEQANRLKEDFLASTSHEIRTPLTAILGFASAMEQAENLTKKQQEFLGIIDKSGKRLLRTVDALIKIAQLRAGTLDLQEDRVNVGETVAKLVDDLQGGAEEKGLTLRLERLPHPAWAQLSKDCFYQVIHNLIHNAIKFTEEGGVVVTLEATRAQVCVQISDTGPGIEEELIPEMFEEFRQASTGIGRRYEGIGLGLTIAARMTRLMGGTIEVDSTPKEGSTFTVCFPNADA